MDSLVEIPPLVVDMSLALAEVVQVAQVVR
jgi:hypothetical protein